MKLPLTCSQCTAENIANANIIATVEFGDNSRYEITCPHGHTSITILQQQKFEILFEIGSYAIIDGYYREAVSSFTSSLERFYEFFIKIICLSRHIDWGVIIDSWKTVSNQSERQLGAFIFLHLQEFHEKPTLLNNNKIKFRNEVIHKGKIPTKEEALNYGQEILNVIIPLISIIKERYNDPIQQTIFRHLQESSRDTDIENSVTTMCIPTILSLSSMRPDNNEINLETAIEKLSLYRWV